MGWVDAIAYGAMVVWVLLLSWIVPRLTPKTPTWLLSLIAAGSVALMVSFFCLYQWVGYPVLAYIDSITFGLVALLAASLLLVKRKE
jgi:hypothetical protein